MLVFLEVRSIFQVSTQNDPNLMYSSHQLRSFFLSTLPKNPGVFWPARLRKRCNWKGPKYNWEQWHGSPPLNKDAKLSKLGVHSSFRFWCNSLMAISLWMETCRTNRDGAKMGERTIELWLKSFQTCFCLKDLGTKTSCVTKLGFARMHYTSHTYICFWCVLTLLQSSNSKRQATTLQTALPPGWSYEHMVDGNKELPNSVNDSFDFAGSYCYIRYIRQWLTLHTKLMIQASPRDRIHPRLPIDEDKPHFHLEKLKRKCDHRRFKWSSYWSILYINLKPRNGWQKVVLSKEIGLSTAMLLLCEDFFSKGTLNKPNLSRPCVYLQCE